MRPLRVCDSATTHQVEAVSRNGRMNFDYCYYFSSFLKRNAPYLNAPLYLYTLRAVLTDDDARLAYGWWLTFAVPTFIR